MDGLPRTAVADAADGRGARDVPRWAVLAGAALWVASAAIMVGLVASRYRGAIGTSPFVAGQNGDFGAFLTAAGTIARSGNPYPAGGTYVYFAPLALVLSLLSHVDRITMLKGWTVAEMAAFVAAAGSMIYALRDRLAAWWEAPTLLAFCAVTGLHLWAMVIELFFSNDDIFVLLALMLAGIALRGDQPVAFGMLVGLAMLIKVWPVLLIVAVLQRGVRVRDRTAAVLALAAMGVVGLATNLIPAGTRELTGFISVVFQAKSQFNISYSVIGIPRVLFSHTGLARPVLVSADVRYLVTGLLGLWVLGMLAVCLQKPGDRMLAVFNVMLFAVLVDPVSHLEYSILALPVVWFWVGHYRVFLDRRGWSGGGLATRALVATAVVAWYVVQQKAWPGSVGAAPTSSSIPLVPLFVVNLVLFTASVLGGRMLLGRAELTSDRAHSQPRSSTARVS